MTNGLPRQSTTVAPLLSVADQGLSASVGFLASVLVGRFLGAEGLGLYAFGYVVVLAVGSFQNALTLQPVSVSALQSFGRSGDRYASFVFCWDRIFVGLALAVIATAAWTAAAVGSLTHEKAIIVLGASSYSFFASLLALLRRQYYGDGLVGRAVFQSSLFLVVGTCALLLAAHSSGASVLRMYLALSLAAATVAVVVGRPWRTVRGLPTWSETREFSKSHIHFARWILPSIPLLIGTHQGYYLIASAVVGDEQAGLVKAVDVLVAPFEQTLIGLSLLYMPRVSQALRSGSEGSACRLTMRLGAFLLLLAGAYAIVLLVLGPHVLPLLFGEDLREGVRLIPILALLPFAQALGATANILAMAMHRPDLNTYSRGAATLVTLTLGVALITWYGPAGAAMGIVLSIGVFALTLAALVRRACRQVSSTH